MTTHRTDNQTHERENTPWIDRYASWLTPGLDVLDLGCGLGHDALDLVALG
jgi:ubiquinone/menaquinone biosynthesis C-methylase UbiE